MCIRSADDCPMYSLQRCASSDVQITISATGVLRLLDHARGTPCQSIYGSATVSDSLNGCWRPICSVFGTEALCDALVRSAVWKSSYLLTYLHYFDVVRSSQYWELSFGISPPPSTPFPPRVNETVKFVKLSIIRPRFVRYCGEIEYADVLWDTWGAQLLKVTSGPIQDDGRPLNFQSLNR